LTSGFSCRAEAWRGGDWIIFGHNVLQIASRGQDYPEPERRAVLAAVQQEGMPSCAGVPVDDDRGYLSPSIEAIAEAE
jgi:hypothetical protein